jgi:alpha-L-fucosidase
VPPARAWDTCLTMNRSWGYVPDDHDYKSPTSLVHSVCEVAGRGGNLLLNVGPMGDGQLPPELTERLAVVERWMSKHRESIVGTTTALEPWQFYGPTTRRDNTVYAHLLMRPYDSVTMRGVRGKRVQSVRALGTGEELKFTTRVSIPDMMLGGEALGELTVRVPESAIDEDATVLALEFAGEPT